MKPFFRYLVLSGLAISVVLEFGFAWPSYAQGSFDCASSMGQLAFAPDQSDNSLSLRTDRLLIRPSEISDQLAQRFVGDPEIHSGFFGGYADIEYLVEHLKQDLADGLTQNGKRSSTEQRLSAVIHRRADMQAIGFVVLTKSTRNAVWKIDYAILSEYRRQGFALETLRAVVQYARSLAPEYPIYAHVYRANDASKALLAKIGFVRQKEDRQARVRAPVLYYRLNPKRQVD